MLGKILGVGLQDSLDFEESIKVKLLNAVSLMFSMVTFVFIIKHVPKRSKNTD